MLSEHEDEHGCKPRIPSGRELCIIKYNNNKKTQIKSSVPGESHNLIHSGHFLMNNWANSPKPDLVRIAHQVYTFDNN